MKINNNYIKKTLSVILMSTFFSSVCAAEQNDSNLMKLEESPEIEKAIDDVLMLDGEKSNNTQEEPSFDSKINEKKQSKKLGIKSNKKKSQSNKILNVYSQANYDKNESTEDEMSSKDGLNISFISKEEADFLEQVEKKDSAPKKQIKKIKKGPSRAYEPAPTQSQEEKHEGFVVERDSSKILKKRMSYTDVLNLKVCFSAGLSIVLDEDIQTEFQRVIIDDKMFFDAIDFDNHRGVYVKLKQPVPDGKYWESAIRLIRKDNDKAYLINLFGVSCPKTGSNPFPKTVYIQDKNPGISGKNSKIMTPEDTVIGLSQGFPRKNHNQINIYDMVARSGSEWVVFGVEVKVNKGSVDPEKFLIRMIDNLQIHQIPTKIDFLPIQSEKATESTRKDTLRYRVLVNIDKQYFIENRYLYLMLLDKKDEYYQYVRIDTLPYLIKLRERGFDI